MKKQTKTSFTKPLLKKKVISRKKPADKQKVYFDMGTQDAIVRWRKEEDLTKKAKIYEQEIHPAFCALAENLINVYKFQSFLESKEDLKNACVQNLYTIIQKYDPDRGSKAFSYFNVVAKHWLTIQGKTNAKNLTTFISIDNQEVMSKADLELVENYNILPACDDVVSEDFEKQETRKLLLEMAMKTKSENEKRCMEAILNLFDNLDNVDVMNKRAAMAYVRDMTFMSPKQLSMVISNLKKLYKQEKKKKLNAEDEEELVA